MEFYCNQDNTIECQNELFRKKQRKNFFFPNNIKNIIYFIHAHDSQLPSSLFGFNQICQNK